MIPHDVLQAMRGRFDLYDLGGLRAATFAFDPANKHLRIDFFFDGAIENLDVEELESGLLTELIADVWSGVEKVGFALVFDDAAIESALLDPARLYPPQ